MFRPVNLSTQLTLMILGVSLGAVALLSTAFWGIEYSRAKEDTRRRLEGMMRIVATSAEWPMVMKEKSLPQRLVDGFAADPEVRIALLFDADKRSYVRYVRKGILSGAEGYFTPERLDEAYRSSVLSIEFSESAIHGFLRLGSKNIVGMLYVESDLHRFYAEMQRYYFGLAGVVLLVASLTFLFSNRVQQILSRQIVSMASRVQHIIESQDFSLRFVKERQDELGVMVDGMNRLLSHIEERDEELHEYNLKLEEKVDERTRELDLNNRRLRAANDELSVIRADLDRMNRAKDRFVATFSHEIRTPLTSIITSAEILREQLEEGEARDIADTLYEAGHGLNEQIDHILNYTKIESGAIELKQEIIDLRTILESLVAQWGDAANRKGLHLLADIPWNVSWRIMGDQTRLRQVFGNLINNAIKFTSEGSVTVSASRQLLGDGRLRIVVDIEDSGPGIPEGVDVFAPYVHSEGAKGSGLGLAIALNLAGCMGGRLSYFAGEKGGTVFRFVAPFTGVDVQVPVVSPLRPDVVVALNDLKLRDILIHRLTEVGISVLEEEGAVPAEGQIWIQDRIPAELPSISGARQVFIGVTGKIAEGTDTLLLKRPVDWYRLQEFLFRMGEGSKKGSVGSNTDHRGILIVEDNVATARLLRIILENRGYKIRHVATGTQAVSEGMTGRYGLILLDIQIPEMDGFSVAGALRQAGVTTPIVAVTALPAESVEQRTVEAGMNGFVPKPFNGVSLLSTVERFVRPPLPS